MSIKADPTDTSKQVGPEYVSGFLRRLVAMRPDAVVAHPERSANPAPQVTIAIDNEPDLWHSTHRCATSFQSLLYCTQVDQGNKNALLWSEQGRAS